MIKKTVHLIFVLLSSIACLQSTAQDIAVASGTACKIAANETFHVNGLTLVPSAAFDLNGLSITKNTTITNTVSSVTSISRHYLFSANSPAYSGTVQIGYLDAELNGLTESTLETNYYNGSAWSQVTSATNDATNNYVLTNALSSTILREITLASSSSPLPVEWLDFTATKQEHDVLLEWSTAQEMNTQDFVVQHSIGGEVFANLNTQAAAGNSSTIQKYNYVHTSPVVGYNYYRIHQRDIDGGSAYSEIRKVEFSTGIATNDIQILGNPIQMNELALITPIDQDIALYSMVGQLCWEKHLEAGNHIIDVSFLPKGTYLLKTSTTSHKLVKL
ncbi:MAG: hypothetical protein ACI8ZQ_000517 [Bacteroidia bacterium]|jgi:hypothetical protein